MEGLTRRKALAAIGGLPLVAGVGALAARGGGLLGGGHAEPRFQPVPASGPQSARAALQRKCPVSLKLARQHVADLRRTRLAETASSWLSH